MGVVEIQKGQENGRQQMNENFLFLDRLGEELREEVDKLIADGGATQTIDNDYKIKLISSGQDIVKSVIRGMSVENGAFITIKTAISIGETLPAQRVVVDVPATPAIQNGSGGFIVMEDDTIVPFCFYGDGRELIMTNPKTGGEMYASNLKPNSVITLDFTYVCSRF